MGEGDGVVIEVAGVQAADHEPIDDIRFTRGVAGGRCLIEERSGSAGIDRSAWAEPPPNRMLGVRGRPDQRWGRVPGPVGARFPAGIDSLVGAE